MNTHASQLVGALQTKHGIVSVPANTLFNANKCLTFIAESKHWSHFSDKINTLFKNKIVLIVGLIHKIIDEIKNRWKVCTETKLRMISILSLQMESDIYTILGIPGIADDIPSYEALLQILQYKGKINLLLLSVISVKLN